MGYKGDSTVEAKELLVIKTVRPKAAEGDQKYGKEGYVIRVVAWVYEKSKGGIGQSVSLEKRLLYLTEDGDVRNGKAKGFLLEDLAEIQPRWKEIVEAIKNAPAPSFAGAKSGSTKAAPAEVDDIEQVPF
jgi:hypothetical protein